MFNYSWGLPIAASSYAHKIDWSLHLLHIVMIAIFVIWGIYMAYCLIRYRRREGVPADYRHPSPLANYIPDGLILAFDIWLIFVIGIPIWAHIKEELPKPENSTVVEITAEQFSWLIRYPGSDGKFGKKDAALVHANNPLGLDEQDPESKDDVVSVNQLVLPLGQPVLITLTAKDVIHSFFVPEFRIKQDAVPGMRVPVWVEPTASGRFELVCAQLCGTGHYAMKGEVLVVSLQEYSEWMNKKMKEKGL